MPTTMEERSTVTDKITDRTELDVLLQLLSMLPKAEDTHSWENLAEANRHDVAYVRGRLAGAVMDVLDRPERLQSAVYLADYVLIFLGEHDDPAHEAKLASFASAGGSIGGRGHVGGGYEWLRDVRAAAWGVKRDNAPRSDAKELREWAGDGRFTWA